MRSKQSLFLLRHRRQRHAAARADRARRRAPRFRAPTARSTRAARPRSSTSCAGRASRCSRRTASGVTRTEQIVVVSAAVEDTVPDVQAARRVGGHVRHPRRAAGATVQRRADSIGVAGTSGKSTTTAMIGWILHDTGRDPTIMNGAEMKNFVTPDVPFASALVGARRRLRQRSGRKRRLDRALQPHDGGGQQHLARPQDRWRSCARCSATSPPRRDARCSISTMTRPPRS